MTRETELPGTDESYWMATSEHPAFPALDADRAADVVVVGGGVAGLSTAWELTRAGRSVVVLEADRVAAGVTGYTTAKLTAAHLLVYDRLRRTRGPEGAARYALSQQAAVERVGAVAAELGIACDLESASAFTFTTDPGRRAEFEAEAEAAAEAGLDAACVRETELPFPVAAAVRVRRQAQFHPRRYLLALASDLRARGGVVHERTRVTGLSEGSPCRVTTESGLTVSARDVVIATHVPVFDRALLFARMSPRRELVVAAPLAAEAAPEHMYITDEGGKRSVRTAPLDADRRLLIVTGEDFTPGTGDAREGFRRLDAWMHEHFPAGPTAYRWAAQDSDVSDGVPLIGPFHPRRAPCVRRDRVRRLGDERGCAGGAAPDGDAHRGHPLLGGTLRPPPAAEHGPRGRQAADPAGGGGPALRGRPPQGHTGGLRRGDRARYGCPRAGRRAAPGRLP
ncbi:hypothetical protein GCM10020227_53030 [Streptomyces flavovirens]